MQKYIIWDVDDVLNDFTSKWLDTYYPENEYNNLISNPPHELLRISLSQYYKQIDEFRLKCDNFLLPNFYVMNWFEKHGKLFNHIICTARPQKSLTNIIAWINKFSLGYFDIFISAPSPRMSMTTRNKSDILNNLNVEGYFIDDSPENFININIENLTCLTFPQPWNNQRLSIQELLEKLIP